MKTDTENTEYLTWNGGECPVDDETRVDVVLRDGCEMHELTAYRMDWTHGGPDRKWDVVSYRESKRR